MRSSVQNVKAKVVSLPVLGPVVRSARESIGRVRFTDSQRYWEERYANGGNSGSGSDGRLAQGKAAILNQLVAVRQVNTVLEMGCGDGSQLSHASYPKYVGVDVSPEAIATCRRRFADDTTKRFILSGAESLPTCDVGLSLDVIYHLVEDGVFVQYMNTLLRHSARMVVLYTSDSDHYLPPGRSAAHVRHRPVCEWMSSQAHWKLVERIANPFPFDVANPDETSFADFYVYERVGGFA